MKLPAEVPPEAITAIIDTREQLPLDLFPLQMERGTLATGDYSVKGLENCISIERKSLSDLLGCMGNGRERFERELERMRSYEFRAVVVECEERELELGQWNSKITPSSATGSVRAWRLRGIPFVFRPGYEDEEGRMVNAHEAAGKEVSRMLYFAARRRWREARGLLVNVTD